MRAWDIIGYAYDASLHCVDCAIDGLGARLLRDADAAKAAGVSPVFASTELQDDEACADCGEPIT